MSGLPLRSYTWWLVLASVAGTILVMPYSDVLLGTQLTRNLTDPIVIIGLLVQIGISYLLVRLGLAAATRTGLAWPPLRGWRTGSDNDTTHDTTSMRASVLLAAGAGALCAILLMALGWLMPDPEMTREVAQPGWVVALLASIGAGLNEEVLLRVFAMSVIVLAVSRLAPAALSRNAHVWTGIIGATLLFGAMHLPQAASFARLDLAMVSTVLGLNGLAGVLFGWLYWKHGIIAAMASHIALDVVLKVIAPAVGGLFVS